MEIGLHIYILEVVVGIIGGTPDTRIHEGRYCWFFLRSWPFNIRLGIQSLLCVFGGHIDSRGVNGANDISCVSFYKETRREFVLDVWDFNSSKY